MRISYSALDTYQSCPLKYKFQEIDKIKTPKSKEAVFGTTIHSTMKFIHTPGILSPTLDQAMEHFTNSWNPAVFDNPDEERAAFSQGIQIIQKYYQSNNPKDFNIIDLESRFNIKIGPIKSAESGPALREFDGVNSDNHIVAGIIDRIDKTDDGYEIIDYKTTKKMPSQEKVDNDLQLSVYLKAFLKRYPKEIDNLDKIKVSLYYLKHGVKLSSTRTLEQLQKSEQLFLDTIKLIEASKFEPAISPLCDWCGYQNLCPMWKHKFKELRKVDTEEANKAISEYIELKSAISITKDRLEKLQADILQYMDQEGVERVFGEDGIIARTLRKTYKYDAQKIREILEPLDKWEDVLKVDGIALRNILATLPFAAKKEAEKAKIIDKESKSLIVKKK
ncbi:MAG: PD-(D/E)XK nuclease family protein [Candidatus Moranbacteria bacterium]|nr:PD-(D/E)XK nuclease family protein [Candidatus Moranbacteria bacterium]